MRLLSLFVTIVLVSACQTLPSPEETQTANYGAFPDNYQTLAKDYLRKELTDPQSIEFNGVTAPVKRWIGDKITGVKYGYVVCVDVNSKNLFGKMTGFRKDAVLIRDGVVIEYIKDGELLSGMKLC